MYEFYTPVEIIEKTAELLENERKLQKLTQEDLCEKSSVSLGTYKDFIHKRKISFETLLKLMFALHLTENIDGLLKEKPASAIEDIITGKPNLPKRVRK